MVEPPTVIGLVAIGATVIVAEETGVADEPWTEEDCDDWEEEPDCPLERTETSSKPAFDESADVARLMLTKGAPPLTEVRLSEVLIRTPLGPVEEELDSYLAKD